MLNFKVKIKIQTFKFLNRWKCMIRLLVTIICTTCAMAFSQELPKSNYSNETKQIEIVLQAYDAAWNNHVPAQLASLFEENADLMTPWGRWIIGKNQIQKYFEVVNTQTYAKSRMNQTIDYLRLVTPNLALVDTSVKISDIDDPNVDKTKPFLLHCFYVIVRVNTDWKILSSRCYMFNNQPVGGG